MKITPLFLAVRAVSAEFARRIYVPVVYGVGISLLVLIALAVWLVTMSGWWWLLLAPLILLTLIFITAAILVRFALAFLRPQQTSAQKSTVRGFVDSLQKTAETIQTPKFVILFRLVKDLLVPGKGSYIDELSGTASSLRSGLKEVINLF